VCVSTFEETLPHDDFTRAEHYAVETARHKAMDVVHILEMNRKKGDKWVASVGGVQGGGAMALQAGGPSCGRACRAASLPANP
jgi:hypothetical protein